MELSIGTTLPGGYKNSLGGSVDPYYAQADGTPWPSVVAACAAVPLAFRRSRTVIVAGIGEMQWLVGDLSNAGLLPKVGGGVSLPTGAALLERAPNFVRIQLSPAVAAQGIGALRVRFSPRQQSTPPTSYDTTLDATDYQADGIVFAPAGNQKISFNELQNASGNVLNISIIDSSDNSSSGLTVSTDYKGTWFKFERANGTFYEAVFPSTDMVLTA